MIIKIIQLIINNIKKLVHFVLEEYKKTFFEITTTIQMVILNNHEPKTDTQYIFFVIGCVSVISLLVKRGKTTTKDMDNIANSFSKITDSVNKITNSINKNEKQKPE